MRISKVPAAYHESYNFVFISRSFTNMITSIHDSFNCSTCIIDMIEADIEMCCKLVGYYKRADPKWFSDGFQCSLYVFMSLGIFYQI